MLHAFEIELIDFCLDLTNAATIDEVQELKAYLEIDLIDH